MKLFKSYYFSSGYGYGNLQYKHYLLLGNNIVKTFTTRQKANNYLYRICKKEKLNIEKVNKYAHTYIFHCSNGTQISVMRI